MKLTLLFLVVTLVVMVNCDEYSRRRWFRPRRWPRSRPLGRCPLRSTVRCILGCTPGDRPCGRGTQCCPNACGTGHACVEPVGRRGVPRSCPRGSPRLNCFVNPCRLSTCPRFSRAVCINDNPCEPSCSGNFYMWSRLITQAECHGARG